MNLKAASAAFIAVTTISAVSCAPNAGPGTGGSASPRQTNRRHITIEAYPSGQTARAAVLTQLNSTGIIGDVEKIGEPVVLHLREDTLEATHTSEDAPVNNLVSTAVVVKVTEPLFGRYEIGDLVTFRILGGETGDNVTTAEQSELLGRLTVGARIAAFGSDAVTYRDGSTQITPSQLFITDADRFVPGLRAHAVDASPTSIEELRRLSTERKAFIASRQRQATGAPRP